MKKISMLWTLVFIAVFIALGTVGANLSYQINLIYSGQVLLYLALSEVLLIYLRKKSATAYVGLTGVSWQSAKRSLLYIPLAIIVLANGALQMHTDIHPIMIIMTVLYMACVGFLEELLFRGLLLKAIQERWNTAAAVIIAALSFGLGHIINLFNGFTIQQEILQIGFAFLIGLVLSLLFVRTGSIVPGIIFHALFNTAATLAGSVPWLNVIIFMSVSAVYMIYLLFVRPKKTAAA